jgi:Cupin domain
MSKKKSILSERGEALPPDDLLRELTRVEAHGEKRQHIGVVGDTYTILLTGDDTAGRFCLIDMHIPPGGGPPSHRHDFEETFTILEGELEVTFRGSPVVVRTVRRSTSRQTHRTAFVTHLRNRSECYASARRRVKRTSFWKSAFPFRPGPPHHLYSTKKNEPPSRRKRRRWLRSTELNCYRTLERRAARRASSANIGDIGPARGGKHTSGDHNACRITLIR